jgi:hypothetical protein
LQFDTSEAVKYFILGRTSILGRTTGLVDFGQLSELIYGLLKVLIQNMILHHQPVISIIYPIFELSKKVKIRSENPKKISNMRGEYF